MRTGLLLAAALACGAAHAAAPATPSPLTPPMASFGPSQQAMPALIQRYQLDHASLAHLYTVRNGVARDAEFDRFYRQWLAALDRLPFDTLGVEDRIDWIMLRNQIEFELREQGDVAIRFRDAEPLVPFARPLIDLAEARRLMQAQDGRATAALLQKSLGEVQRATERLKAGGDVLSAKPLASRSTANRAVSVLGDLSADLKEWYGYYDGYDPQLTWWVKQPYITLNKAIADYSALLDERLVGKESAKLLNVTGDPIGRTGLVSALKREMLPYTPEELMALAEKELAWGEAELRVASREMGFGDDWRAAMEKVKNMYVAPGEQPAMVRALAREAIDYVTKNDMVTVPEVALRSWRMDMLSAESQMISPFFLGGDTIQVSYPTDAMNHEQKLMTMRGNNPHFSRAVVHHELIPGHHLQMFMADRYQPQRKLFDSPFFVEGWAVYWEMLLYDRKFAVKPEDRIGMMFWRNHRAARILFSLGFHLGKITPEQAVDMLIKRVGHEPDNARAEVRRSFNGDYSPLYQAGYMIGALQLRALNKELVGGGAMSLKRFHDGILEGGMLPAELVRARLKGEKIPRDFRPTWRFYN
ncbi:DUF885 family protein [Massilia soli]|uniref:DUF885 domain-containing protein n=1 Tax=Massilia soli TaxID=2792854 RepID=A0ABS7SIB7_9BURK|nr:DUF885 family protein [Massilia soli]MBZ2205960.1 DUF885 domain-containing protein [Massilia soli]